MSGNLVVRAAEAGEADGSCRWSVLCGSGRERAAEVPGRPRPGGDAALGEGTGGEPHSYAAFVPMGRIGQPDEIANAVVWLLSDDTRYVTGHTLPVDGGVCAV